MATIAVGTRLKLPTGEIIKFIEVGEVYAIAKRSLRGRVDITPLYTYLKADIDALDSLGGLEDMIIKEDKSVVPTV